MKKFNLLVFGCFIFSQVFSQVNYVSQLNDPLFYGGKIKVMAKNSTCLLVGTEGGIFKSTDHGISWTNVSKNFDQATLNCDEIVSLGEVFYASSDPRNGSPNIYKSINNGESWEQISVLGINWIETIGAMSNTLYAVCGTYKMTEEGNQGKLYASTDGINWIPKATVWSGNWTGGDCELYTFNQNKLYLKLQNNLYYTMDGNSLVAISATGLNESDFSNVENIDGDIHGNLFCRSNNAILKYDFVAQKWNDITSGKIPNDFFIIQISVTDNAIFFDALNQSFEMKIFKSFDQGNTFTEIPISGNVLPATDNIQETAANTFIGNGLYGDVYFSSNGGDNWSSNTGQFMATYTGNLAKSGNNLLFSRENLGVVSSVNGENWATANNGIPSFGGMAYFVSELAQVHDTLFSMVSPDPFSETVSLYRSTDNGVSWSVFDIPAPYNNGEEFHIAGKCDSLLFINYYDIATANYELISMSIKTGSCVRPGQSTDVPVFVKGTKNCLFAFYGYSSNDYFNNVYKVNNFGVSFTDIGFNDLQWGMKTIKRIYKERDDFAGPMMDVDNINNYALFVIQDRSDGILDKLYKYDVKTSSWTELNAGGLPLNYVGNCLNYIGNNEWLLATNFGLYRSTDGGSTWAVAHTSGYWQNGIIVSSIVKMNNKIFLGTVANGMWVVDLSTGLVKPSENKELIIFPNPVATELSIVIPEWKGNPATIKIFNLQGKEVLNKTVMDNPICLPMKSYASGTYFVELKSNGKIYHQTIIKK